MKELIKYGIDIREIERLFCMEGYDVIHILFHLWPNHKFDGFTLRQTYHMIESAIQSIIGIYDFDEYRKAHKKYYYNAIRRKRRESGFTQKFRKQILKRDNYSCQFCNLKSYKGLHIHHFDRNPTK